MGISIHAYSLKGRLETRAQRRSVWSGGASITGGCVGKQAVRPVSWSTCPVMGECEEVAVVRVDGGRLLNVEPVRSAYRDEPGR